MNKSWPIIVLLSSVGAFAQLPGPEMENLTDIQMQPDAEEITSELVSSTLLDIYSHKVNLNEVTPEFFLLLAFVQPEQVKKFFQYRIQSGGFQSIYELQSIPQWDLATCRLLSMVTFVPASNGTSVRNGKTEFIFRQEQNLEKKKGFREGSFIGDRNKFSVRYKTSITNHSSISLAAEKDAGEKFTLNFPHQLGFDHMSGNLTIKQKGVVEKLILGDFRIQTGQGLINGNSYGTGKGNETITSIRQPDTGLSPSASFAEFGYLRGIAISLKKGRFLVTTYSSLRKIDASLKYDSLMGKNYFTSINESGLHRTSSEILSRNTITNWAGGTVLEYHSPEFLAGIQIKLDHFDKPMQSTKEPYRHYMFSGKSNASGGIFMRRTWENIYFFSESAISKNYALASVIGTIISITNNLDISILTRYYNPSYVSFNSKAFGVSSANNERGIYWGLKWKFARKLQVSAYYDFYQHPWLKYGINGPSKGNDYLLRMDFVDKKTPLYLTFSKGKKQISMPVGSREGFNPHSSKTKVVFNCKAIINKQWESSFRVGISIYKEETREKGFLLAQQIKYIGKRGSVKLGYSLFDTSSFSSGFYINEPDVRYKTLLVSLSDNGIRYFTTLNLKLSRQFSFWIKYDLTDYFNKTEVGSGTDTITGNKKSEIRTELIYTID